MGWYQREVQPRLLNAVLDNDATRSIRRRVCSGLVGEVLEVGYGSGLNDPFLPAEVAAVWAVEPSVVALRLATGRSPSSRVPVTVVGADAQRMSLGDDTVDAALSTWTMCGIEDPVAALREISRVLKPGGELHFVEHGLSPDPGVARWQRRGNRLNKRIAGCVLDRDVRSLVEQSGLTLTALDTYYEAASPKPAGYFYEGRAVA